MHKHLFRYRLIALILALGMLPNALNVAEAQPNVVNEPDPTRYRHPPKVETPSKVVYGLNQPIEQIEFRSISIGDALRILSEQSALNIVASKKASDLPVTMFLRHVTPMEVLDALAKTNNLLYKHDDESNIIRLYTAEEYRSEQVEYRKEETEVFTMKNAKNALDLAESIQNLFSPRVLISYGQNQQQLMIDLQQRFARFDVVDRRTKQNFGFTSGTTGGAGQGNTGVGGNVGGGIAGGNINTGVQNSQMGNGNFQANSNNASNSNNTNIEANQTTVIKTEVAGDAEKVIDTVDNNLSHHGLIHVGVIKQQNRVLVRTRDTDAMNEIKRLKQQIDVESSMVLMEVKVLQVDLSDGFQSLFDFTAKSGTAAVSTLNAVGAAAGSLATAASAFNPALLATVVGKNFELRLQLLEQENRVTMLGTPILITANQEVSRFLVGQNVPILVNYTAGSVSTSSGNTLTGTGNQIVLPPAPVYEQRTIGNTLLLTPSINADKTVNIQIVVEESILVKGGATILVPPSANCTTSVLGGNCSAIPENIDIVNEKTFSGSVIASDNATIAVGGLIQENASNNENKVPFLGDIPVLGFFFRDETQARARTELVVMIKPHIINSPSEAQAISQKVVQQNSIHPNSAKPTTMGVYSNPDKQHKGYRLEETFKEYNNQDSLDRYKWDNPNPRR